MDGWQPIETAPRYEWVMLFEPNGVYDTPGLTHWIAKWVFIDGEFGWFDQDASLVCSNPTHWMPLPPPPHTGPTT